MNKSLLQQALDALLPHGSSYGNGKRPIEDAAIERLGQALAQQEQPAQEPCSVRITWTKLGTKFTDFFDFDNPTSPIARDGTWRQGHWNARHLRQGNTGVKLVKLESVIMLYTHPAATQPALSDHELLEIGARHSKPLQFGREFDEAGWLAAGRAIEAHCRGGVK